MPPAVAKPKRLPAAVVGALGIVFGNIGTSPLYALRMAFDPVYGLEPDPANVLALLSMIVWSMTIIVTLKYVTILPRFDHRGEGGVLALLSHCTHELQAKPRLRWVVTVLGALAVSFFFGDVVMTPAITLLSAAEGLSIIDRDLDGFVVPLVLLVLIALSATQRRNTGHVAARFGPVMALWFVAIAVAGIAQIVRHPQVLLALDPRQAWFFLLNQPGLAFVAAGAVFLCMTGAEALYADLGRFGVRPVRAAWLVFVFPALLLSYFGQGALLLHDPQAIRNPFFLLVPADLRLPMVVLACLAAVIAAQATITAAFFATQQASRLNFLPRLRVVHVSDAQQGKVYVPVVNTALLLLGFILVIGFGSSAALAPAYGIAIAGDLMLTSLIVVVSLPFFAAARVRMLWLLFFVFFLLEAVFFAARATWIQAGGWFPVGLAILLFIVLTTWRRGTDILRLRKDMQLKANRDGYRLDLSGVPRVPGSALFFSPSLQGWPSSFVQNLKHNKIMHEQTIFLTVVFDDAPRVFDNERIEVMRSGDGIVRVVAHFGFRENPRIDGVLRELARKDVVCTLHDTSFFTSRPTLVSVSRRGLFSWRRSLFGWLLRNSTSVANYFGLPPDRVVELGTQVAV